MARTISLDDLIAAVQWQADVEGAVQRHTPLKITDALNLSNQAFRLMISSVSDYYKKKSAVLTLAAADDTIPVPADFVRLYGFDIQIQGRWREVLPFQFSERNRYQDAWLTSGPPTYFRERDASLIDIMPASDGAYSYRIWYLPTGDELSASVDFDGIAGWEDWLIFDSALRISTRDADVNDNYQYLQTELARVEKRIIDEASKRTIPKAGRRLDTKGRRGLIEDRNWWRRNA